MIHSLWGAREAVITNVGQLRAHGREEVSGVCDALGLEPDDFSVVISAPRGEMIVRFTEPMGAFCEIQTSIVCLNEKLRDRLREVIAADLRGGRAQGTAVQGRRAMCAPSEK